MNRTNIQSNIPIFTIHSTLRIGTNQLPVLPVQTFQMEWIIRLGINQESGCEITSKQEHWSSAMLDTDQMYYQKEDIIILEVNKLMINTNGNTTWNERLQRMKYKG